MSPLRVFKAEGIILKRKNVGEADRILTIFTKEYGKLRVIAKGIRKITSRRAPHLEVFTRVQVVIHEGRTLPSVSEVNTLNVFEHVRSDLRKVSLAYYLCDLIDSLLPDRQDHPDIFAFLTGALSDLEAQESVGNLYSESKSFTLEVLWTLGFLPRSKSLNGNKLQQFIETITERSMKSTHFAKLLMERSPA